jgi:hypothetical protein
MLRHVLYEFVPESDHDYHDDDPNDPDQHQWVKLWTIATAWHEELAIRAGRRLVRLGLAEIKRVRDDPFIRLTDKGRDPEDVEVSS